MNVDPQTYQRRLGESVSIADYVFSPFRFEHQNKCRHELGIIGGTGVSHIAGNMVDLESDLRGQTRLLSKCGGNQWKPIDTGVPIVNDKTPPISTQSKHLPSCQMIGYRSVPLPPPMNLPRCS